MNGRPEARRGAAGALPDSAYVAALAHLPDMTPARLGALLGAERAGTRGLFATPAPPPLRTGLAAWTAVLDGSAAKDARAIARCKEDPRLLSRTWPAAAAWIDVHRMWARYVSAGVRLAVLGTRRYPTALASEPDAPYVLFYRGRLSALEQPRVAIVGTRRCTNAGRETAEHFGEALARRGVAVVSGLALGIDAAAHRGALRAWRAAPSASGAPIGVVAGGLDRPYPARHRGLWEEVGGCGLLLTSSWLGVPSESWRFPARNKVLVAGADVVVVVESHATGGSMVTAGVALERNTALMAVPGAIQSPASAGSNRLLRDGVAPACDVDDVLVAVGLARGGCITPTPGARSSGRAAPGGSATPSTAGGPSQARVGIPPRRLPPSLSALLDSVDWRPTLTETIVARTARHPVEVATALAELEELGDVRRGDGWWERRQAGSTSGGEGGPHGDHR